MAIAITFGMSAKVGYDIDTIQTTFMGLVNVLLFFLILTHFFAATGMPILRLLSAISLSLRHSEGSGDKSLALSPLFLSFMYVAQWIVAILLLLFACPRNFGSILPSFFARGGGKRIRGVIDELPGGRVSLIHWKQSQEHTKKVSLHLLHEHLTSTFKYRCSFSGRENYLYV